MFSGPFLLLLLGMVCRFVSIWVINCFLIFGRFTKTFAIIGFLFRYAHRCFELGTSANASYFICYSFCRTQGGSSWLGSWCLPCSPSQTEVFLSRFGLLVGQLLVLFFFDELMSGAGRVLNGCIISSCCIISLMLYYFFHDVYFCFMLHVAMFGGCVIGLYSEYMDY